MQATSKEIYQQVADKNDLSVEIVKSVGDAFFKEWSNKLKNPKTIILKIKKLGRMYMRKNKLYDYKERTIGYFNSEKPLSSPEQYNEMRRRELELYQERLIEYEDYLDKKKEIRALRWPHQPLIIPPNDPDRED